MNEERRKKIKEALDKLSDVKDLIDQTKEEEQAAFDNLPEGLQASEQGVRMEEIIGVLEEASETCDGIDTELGSLI